MIIVKVNCSYFLAIKQEEGHMKFKDGIENFDKDKLVRTPTIVKNTLPTKEVIDQVLCLFKYW